MGRKRGQREQAATKDNIVQDSILCRKGLTTDKLGPYRVLHVGKVIVVRIVNSTRPNESYDAEEFDSLGFFHHISRS